MASPAPPPPPPALPDPATAALPDPATAALPDAATAALQRRFGAHFVAITRAWRREADLALAPLGLSHATASALLLLLRQPEVGGRQGALAAALGIEQPSLVPLLDQLCRAALVERRPDPADRRARSLHLTAAGATAAEAAEARLDALRQALLGGIPDSELAAASRVLDRMAAAFARNPTASLATVPPPTGPAPAEGAA